MKSATLRRLSHDLRGSVANLRIGLQACRETPDLLAQLGGPLLEEVEKLDRRLLQLSWMARCADPQRQPCQLQALLSSWTQALGLDAPECPPLEVNLDPDLFRVAFEQICHNAVVHAGGIAKLTVRVSATDWELELVDRGPGWPEGLASCLASCLGQPKLWRNQIALGLPLVQKVLTSHGGSLCLDQAPTRWRVPLGGT